MIYQAKATSCIEINNNITITLCKLKAQKIVKTTVEKYKIPGIILSF